MKKLKLTGKLSLNKETISKLNDDQMNGVRGGGPVPDTQDVKCLDSFNAVCWETESPGGCNQTRDNQESVCICADTTPDLCEVASLNLQCDETHGMC